MKKQPLFIYKVLAVAYGLIAISITLAAIYSFITSELL